ncbi:MAG: hypothetical protein AAFZ04_08055 [Pseudomonadota bacterium]
MIAINTQPLGPSESTSKTILNVAEALDVYDRKTAETGLLDLVFVLTDQTHAKTILALWQNHLQKIGDEDLSPGHKTALIRLLTGLHDYDGSAAKTEEVIALCQGSAVLPGAPYVICAALLPHRQQFTPSQILVLFEIAMLGSHADLILAYFTQLIHQDRAFCPNFWWYTQIWRKISDDNDTRRTLLNQTLETAQRFDLRPLLDVYELLNTQKDLAALQKIVPTLEDEHHLYNIANYLCSVPHSDADLRLAAEIFDDLTARISTTGISDMNDLMSIRRDLVNDDFDTAMARKFSGGIESLGFEFANFQAIACAYAGHHRKAEVKATRLIENTGVPWFIKNVASQTLAVNNLKRDGRVFPDPPGAELSPVAGSPPVAQSLWVGKRLRWTEQLSIQSFLDNGWRYQLYVYDMPENVPDGVEVLDATCILPEACVFRETASSLLHQGSLGAFSDWFRYQLLVKKGGLWVDTDVINLRPFRTNGCKYLTVENVGPKFNVLNGAILCADVGDPMIKLARDRAERLVDQGDIHFTRIGPQLIAEIFSEFGPQGFKFYDETFLNPIGWIDLHRLLQPFEDVTASMVSARAFNIHLFTETWRVRGMSLNTPPEPGSFIGDCYAGLMGSDKTAKTDWRNFIEAINAE